jgi:ankyrin repeat protein
MGNLLIQARNLHLSACYGEPPRLPARGPLLFIRWNPRLKSILHSRYLGSCLPTFSASDYLIQRGADVNVADYHGLGVLHWAAQSGGGGLTRLGLAKGAEVNATDRWGKTPLMLAMETREHAV